MPRTSWNRAFELSPRSPQRLAGASESAGEDILTALRGFCLFISNIHTAGISAQNPLKYSIPLCPGTIRTFMDNMHEDNRLSLLILCFQFPGYA